MSSPSAPVLGEGWFCALAGKFLVHLYPAGIMDILLTNYIS